MEESKRIIQETIRLFNQKGASFTMSELAANLQISKKTIYKYYETKEQILNEIISEVFKSIKTKENQIFTSETLTLSEKLIEILCVYPDYDPVSYKYIHKLSTDYPEIYKTVTIQLESNWDQTFDLLSQGIEAGLILPIDAEDFKIILLGLYKQLLLVDAKDPKEKMRTCIEFIFKGLLK